MLTFIVIVFVLLLLLGLWAVMARRQNGGWSGGSFGGYDDWDDD